MRLILFGLAAALQGGPQGVFGQNAVPGLPAPSLPSAPQPPSQTPTPVSDKHVSIKEIPLDSPVVDVVYLDPLPNNLLVRTANGKLYRSKDGGSVLEDYTSVVVPSSSKATVTGLVVAPSSRQVVVATTSGSGHFISEDSGQSWRRMDFAHKINQFAFHPERSSWGLASAWVGNCDARITGGDFAFPHQPTPNPNSNAPCRHELYITRTAGKSFSMVANYVVQFAWGDAKYGKSSSDRVWFTQYRTARSGNQGRLTSWSSDVDLVHSDDGGATHRVSLSQGNKFLVSGGYMFVATLEDAATQNVKLMVSTDGGMKFEAARLPVTNFNERSYTILDASSGGVAIAVNHGQEELLERAAILAGKRTLPEYEHNSGLSNVYISDASGLRYSLSLPNVLRAPSGDCEFDRVHSLGGIYLANYRDVLSEPEHMWHLGGAQAAHEGSGDEFLDSEEHNAMRQAEDFDEYSEDAEYDSLEAEADFDEDLPPAAGSTSSVTRSVKKSLGASKRSGTQVIKTVISLDRGSSWQYLRAPKVDSLGANTDCDYDHGCYLHLYGVSNKQGLPPFYAPQEAVGLVMGTGNLGLSLSSSRGDANTYISRDGGLTWAEAHKGPYIYEMGDSGGLTLMADVTRKTNLVVFSWNEGSSWYDFALGSRSATQANTGQGLSVDNIITEPNSASTKFLLYGTSPGGSGLLYHLDLDTLGQPACKGVFAADSVSSDYETWIPHDGVTRENGQRCLFGASVSYTRRKPASECFNGEKFARPIDSKPCTCHVADYECEMGFARQVGGFNDYTCRAVDIEKVYLPSEVAAACSSSGTWQADAYRKIPGNQCKGGFVPSKVTLLCPKSSRMATSAVTSIAIVILVVVFCAGVAYLSRFDWFVAKLRNTAFASFASVGYSTLGQSNKRLEEIDMADLDAVRVDPVRVLNSKKDDGAYDSSLSYDSSDARVMGNSVPVRLRPIGASPGAGASSPGASNDLLGMGSVSAPQTSISSSVPRLAAPSTLASMQSQGRASTDDASFDVL